MAIGTLTIGTQVLAFNEQTGQNEYDPITAVHRNIDPAVTYLTLKDGKTEQAETITTTPEHPFYLQAQADAQARPRPVGHEELNSHWVGAGHLQIGDKIKQANGSMGTVANVVTVQQTQEMFNLTVGKAHTFYVGDREWLVHNTYCGEIIYGALDSLGRPTGVVATVTKQMIGTGTDASGRIIPPGYVATATNYWSRGHLLANLLGGSGDIPENLVTLVQNGANSPVMSMLENSVRKHIVETGNSIKYTATPIYEGASLIPRGITISAEGKGFIKKFVTVLNVPMR